MVKSLKASFYRAGTRLASRVLWRKKPQNLHIETHSLKTDDGSSFRLRVYTPPGNGPFPVVMYLHGGGFVIGDIDVYDGPCRDLAVQSGRVVVSVDYRLAPEYPFPAAPEDCLQALDWVVANIDAINGDRARIVVAGDSAGGNLAAVIALQARERHPGLLKGQILIYPVTDHYTANFPSYEENATGYLLTRKLMHWFWDTYLAGTALGASQSVEHPLATPLKVADLAGLPPALVITAELDPLRDEGVAYAGRLEQQGVAVQHSQYENLQHGFVGLLGPTADHQRAMEEMVAWLNQVS